MTRKISNEESVLLILSRYGFNKVCLEDYSFEEQVEIMINVKHLIANHGAGLTNMLLMQKTGNVLELRKEGDSNSNCFYSLASALNHNYFYQLCQPDDSIRSGHSADLIVDCNLLEINIKMMLDK